MLVTSSSFTKARYVVRFDDLCPTMNWKIWEDIEEILLQADVNPVLAVVPDNRDPDLMLNGPNPVFWDRVRAWQQRGWTIGMHGFQHRYETDNAGILGLNARSEFAGLSEPIQERKLVSGKEIFFNEGIRTDLWVAPAHSFDATTIRLLRRVDIGVISDGFSFRPYQESDMVWIPQQLWRFRPFPWGVWTVCLHHNHWVEEDLEIFRLWIDRFKHLCTSIFDLTAKPVRGRGIADKSLGAILKAAVKARRWMRGGSRK